MTEPRSETRRAGTCDVSPHLATHRRPREVEIPHRELAELCRRNHIQRLALFGSILSERFRPDSDIDVLVDFEPGHVPGLGFIRLQDELSELFGGRKVDLVTRKALHPRIRARILKEAEVQYAAT